MTQMVTRCPKCATAFRITSTQLESAKGAVRCGSCLHIFKAQEYLVKNATAETVALEKPKAAPIKTEPPKAEPRKAEPVKVIQAVKPAQTEKSAPAKPAAKPVTPATLAKPNPQTSRQVAPLSKPAPTSEKVSTKPFIDKAKALEDEDDVLISDDMDKTHEKASTYEFDGFVDIDLQPKQTVSLFEREIRYETPHDDDDDEENADESWAEELLDDDEETIHQLRKPTPPAASTHTSNRQPDENKPAAETTPTPSTAYSGPVFSLINESTDEPKGEPFFSEAFLNATRAPEAAPVEASVFAAALFEQDADADTDESEKPSGKRAVKSNSKMRAFDTSRAALLMNIMPAPVELTARRMRRWYQKRLWPSLAILMGILLFFQVAYFKSDYFSRVEPYRTAYLFICPAIGCEVPTLVDTSQILATNLIVRNHPDIENALMVDAILINNAPFEQPFPDLILSFSKIDETPVASRRFTPKEYLGGELAGMKYIPERQPVHITIEISDPGAEAVNYTLATH